MRRDNAKLEMWQDRLARAESAYSGEYEKFDHRERLYRGERSIKGMTRDDRDAKAPHIRNICAEIIEAQIDSSIPQPKVTARREKDRDKAKLIEDMLRNELDRMNFEEMNDMMSRTIPIQGGAGFLVEWDNSQRTHQSIGELVVSDVHPKKIIPQDGIYTGIEDMDYIFLLMPQTREYIRRKYDVSLEDEAESDPEVKGMSDEAAADGMVTQIIAYYRNDSGGIGLYSWVNDVELEDIDDYQARRLEKCKDCGGTAVVNDDGVKVCSECGGTEFEDGAEDYEEVWQPIMRKMGEPIPGAQPVGVPSETMVDAYGLPMTETVMQPTMIPFYKPAIYPIILQKNVSLFGSFLGGSDLDTIEDQQNTTNRIHKCIIDKLIQAGSYMTLPNKPSIKVDTEKGKVIRINDPSEKAMIDSFDMDGDISQDAAYLEQVYQESRQLIGITDSFQGRSDSTATSGKAKEFAAAQSAGRLESKRVMRNAAYAKLFEAMFKFRLAYTDEPMPVRSQDMHGNPVYQEFSRYDFLEQDSAGEWYWNDEFLFSCDTSAPLANNREAMWQETRLNLQTGAFGNPQSLDTLILFWRKMEMLHYPDAAQTRMYLEEQLQKQQAMQMQQMQMQAQQIQMAAKEQAYRDAASERVMNRQAQDKQTEDRMLRGIAERARQDAARDAMRQNNQQTGSRE